MRLATAAVSVGSQSSGTICRASYSAGSFVGSVRASEVDPLELGIPRADAPALRGGDLDTNATVARQICEGKPGAHRDIVVLNAAAGIVASGLADDLATGLDLAQRSVDDGAAAAVLDGLVSVSQARAAQR